MPRCQIDERVRQAQLLEVVGRFGATRLVEGACEGGEAAAWLPRVLSGRGRLRSHLREDFEKPGTWAHAQGGYTYTIRGVHGTDDVLGEGGTVAVPVRKSRPPASSHPPAAWAGAGRAWCGRCCAWWALWPHVHCGRGLRSTHVPFGRSAFCSIHTTSWLVRGTEHRPIESRTNS